MPRKPTDARAGVRAKERDQSTRAAAEKSEAVAKKAAQQKRRAPKRDNVAAPPTDTKAAAEHIERIRAAQSKIHPDAVYKPLPPSAELVDEQGNSSFHPDYYELVFNYCLMGATNEDLAYFLAIPLTTIQNWLVKDELFIAAAKAGRQQADARVSTSLYRRAIGYSHKAVKIFYDAKEGHVEEVEYTQHYPPETTAGIFWLKNRQPDKWKDRITQELSGPNGKPIEIQNVRTALAERLARLADANTAGRSDPVRDAGGDDRDQSCSDREKQG